MLEYIDLKYKPSKKDLIVEYKATPNNIPLKKLCEHLAGESSIGTWTDISTMNPSIAKKLKPNVFSINKKTNIIKIAYNEDLFEPGNMPVILSSIAGNIFGMKVAKYLRLEDITFPKSIINSFPGPKHGIKGIRKLLNIKHRPLVGTIVKPKVGLNSKQHATVAYNAWKGGLDIVKDDENLGSMKFNKFRDRAIQTFKLRDKAEQETGEKKIYMINITGETIEMTKKADFVKDLGGEYIMVDIITSGWGALQTIRNHSSQVIHAHRAMHGAFTRPNNHGISMKTISKCARLCGVDQLHIGTAHVGKMEGKDTLECQKAITEPLENIKKVFPVASGGLSPLNLPKLLDKMGTNIIAQFGGGCHGHPNGTESGAKAIRQALEASMHKISLKKYAELHPELSLAISKWG